MYLPLKKDVIITLNVMGSFFKSFFRENQIFLAFQIFIFNNMHTN
jgi:hypothetical protein